MVNELYFTAIQYVMKPLHEVTEQEIDKIFLNLWRQFIEEVEFFDDYIVVIALRAKQVFLHLLVETLLERHWEVWPFKIHEPDHYSMVHLLNVVAERHIVIYDLLHGNL